MPDDKKFTFSLDELATDQDAAQEEELRKEITKSAGNCLSAIKKLAEQGDINRLRAIESALNDTLNGRNRRPSRDDETAREPRQTQATAPAHAATVPVLVMPDPDDDVPEPADQTIPVRSPWRQRLGNLRNNS